jgi:3-oxoacyl-[acyl-carrier protein] reductase
MSATFKGPDGKDVELPFIDPNQNGAFVAYLCSEKAAWISGQIFGTGNDRVAILEQPRYGTAIHRDGGWSTEALAEKFEGYFRDKLQPIGIMKRPYPFYDGVAPTTK